MSKRSRRKRLLRKKFDAGDAGPEEHAVHRQAAGRGFFERNYKKLLIIPFLMLVLALVQIGIQAATTGDFLIKGVSLKGGITITVPSETPLDVTDIQNALKSEFPGLDINVRSLTSSVGVTGITVEADATDPAEQESIIQLLQKDTQEPRDSFSIEEMGSSLGSSFFRQTIIAILIAFVFMGIVVFLYFRTIVPSIAVILAAFSDIVVTLAIANLLGVKMSTAGIAAFLMLIGYSVDTDILLSTRLLKRKEGQLSERIASAFKTGITMTLTTIAAVIVALIVSDSEVISQIMLIILIGLVVDIINTWIQNLGLLRWYLKNEQG